ncbi:efflux RND transporter periplasmic adaptor subunit [Lichenicola sp.]|uniref:efflux RND transporter periplasmic adaptor subunit n=1 Tax=Lichenicola sp. TaxID=2804529 RepID=UPI003B005C79
MNPPDDIRRPTRDEHDAERDDRDDHGARDAEGRGGDAGRDAAPSRRDQPDHDGRDEPRREAKQDEPPPAAPPRRYGLYVAVPLALLIAWGVYSHWQQSSSASNTLSQSQHEVPDVEVAKAKKTSDVAATSLPGQTVAYASADLYARATGYIGQRYVDIGSRVRKGDLLLKIAAPDLDQQLEQARAQLGQMQAQLAEAQASLKQAQATSQNAKINSARSQILASEGWGTVQDRDNQVTNFNVSTQSVGSAQAGIGVAVANVRAQQATVDRLVALTGFENVVAPFDGIITQRNVDIGTLVQSDTNSGTTLLHIDQDDVLRCQVYVPQSQFVGIHVGLPAHVTVPELPGKVFKAVVSRFSSSLAQNSRSELVEVDIDNRDHTLSAGLFVTVAFDVQRPEPLVVIPDAALIFDASGLHVAVLDGTKVSMRPIVINRDTGTEAELGHGLQGGEQVIVNPPTDLVQGQTVHLKQQGGDDKKQSGAKATAG